MLNNLAVIRTIRAVEFLLCDDDWFSLIFRSTVSVVTVALLFAFIVLHNCFWANKQNTYIDTVSLLTNRRCIMFSGHGSRDDNILCIYLHSSRSGADWVIFVYIQTLRIFWVVTVILSQMNRCLMRQTFWLMNSMCYRPFYLSGFAVYNTISGLHCRQHDKLVLTKRTICKMILLYYDWHLNNCKVYYSYVLWMILENYITP